MPHRHDLKLLSDRISSELSKNPDLTLSALSQDLGIDRHILEHAVLRVRRVHFGKLKRQIRFAIARRLLRTLSVKEAAHQLGMSPNALSRFIKVLTGKPPTRHKW